MAFCWRALIMGARELTRLRRMSDRLSDEVLIKNFEKYNQHTYNNNKKIKT